MNLISKIRVYTNGLIIDGVGAYAYIVLESPCHGEVKIGDGAGIAYGPSAVRTKFAMAGPATDEMRMKMRAVYEGVRHCQDGTEVDVYTDNFLIDTALRNTERNQEDGDIAVRYRQYVAEHRVQPSFIIIKHYNEKDLPDNDHDEWNWLAYHLCEKAIENYNNEHK